MRTQIPKFRLPDSVIDEEVGYVLGHGHRVSRRRAHRFAAVACSDRRAMDAVFVGSGAPRGRDLDIPGRREAAANIHIGIDWLSSVSFGHTTKIGRRVVVLGGGNTAMDCCRSSRRLGGEEVQVVVRSGFDEMKASPWEKEDAMHEGIPIHNYLVPKAFTHEDGPAHRRDASRKSRRRSDAQGTPPARARPANPASISPATTCSSRRPGKCVSVDRARPRPRLRRPRHAGRRQGDDGHVAAQRVLRRRRRLRAEEHHLGGRARPRRRDLDRPLLPRRGADQAAAAAREPRSRRRWASTSGATTTRSTATSRYRVPLQGQGDRAEGHPHRGRARLRSQARATPKRSAASTATCRRCSPTGCASSAMPASTSARWTASRSRRMATSPRCGRRSGAGPEPEQALYVSPPVKTGRVMVKDEDVCLHCGLCAERCPTGAWDMQKFLLDMGARRRSRRKRGNAQAAIRGRRHGGRLDRQKVTREADSPRQRLRRQVRQRQRLGLGVGERPVRPRDPAHGRAGRRAQHLSFEYPGPADLVRSARRRSAAGAGAAAAST